MPKSLTIGNGTMLVGIDHRAAVRDFYFPYVGLENHVSGASGVYRHRIGIWVDETFHWLDDDAWQVSVDCHEGTMAGNTLAVNETLGVNLLITDVVYNEHNIYIRKVVVENKRGDRRHVKVFFGQQFRISESRRGDTGFYDPRVHAIIHYKGNRAFLVNATSTDAQGVHAFDDYSTGLFDIEQREGTYIDAHDGTLEKNAIEHGSVDSVVGLGCDIDPESRATVHYWIAAGESIEDVHELNAYVERKTPEHLIKTTKDYWRAWVNKQDIPFGDLDGVLVDLFQKSLFVMRTHEDDNGAIIASSDSDILQRGRDTYSYMWPRDAALIAHGFDRAGFDHASWRFFNFASKLLTKEGYFMHKYRSDGSLGSSWHPWVRAGEKELPIQEDETALVIYMLHKHYLRTKDLEFIESIYTSFIEPAARFMCEYTDGHTHLPLSTYDLWEEKYGTSTYTSSAVYGALLAASDFALRLGKRVDAKHYSVIASRMKDGILKYLYDKQSGMFVKMLEHTDEGLMYDRTIDMSSLHGIVFFDILPVSDRRVKQSVQIVSERLAVPTDVGGIMRYTGDNYYRVDKDAPSNPWFVTTLWLAQYYIKAAKSVKDLDIPYQALLWTAKHARETGILSEQLHAHTGEHLSVAPLTWSHAEYVITVMDYMEKKAELEADTQ